MNDYDSIAKQYHKVAILPIAVHLKVYTYFNILGNLENKSILDLACGDGVYTRKFKPSAKYVVGMDLSEKMIEFARQEEAREPLGIEYVVGDVLELDKIGRFDLVVAALLLHYAQTKEQLLKMCQNIYVNLKNGGRFVTINGNFDEAEVSPEVSQKLQKYGTPNRALGLFQEGDPITLTSPVLTSTDCQKFNFDIYYFTKATYKWAFQEAGFKEVHWHEATVSPEGIQEFGQEFWQDALDYPLYWFIECVK
jgi:ubiquinone/menaquinone biosynthesis C-methylase UbiE